MTSRSADMISLALKQSFTPNYKKCARNPSIDDQLLVSARRVLSTKISYIRCPQYSATEYLKNLKSKYIVLMSSRSRRKKKKKSKNKRLVDMNQSPMMNIEQIGQNLSLPKPKVILFEPHKVQLGWKQNFPVGSGFVNYGTTCYINSTLQALFHVPSFVNWLLGDQKHMAECEKMNGCHHSECIVCAMFKTLRLSHQHNSGTFRPKYIVDRVKAICKHLSPYRQEDAHEFLRYLMEAMEKSYITSLGYHVKKLDSFSKETTPLNQIFGGYIRTEVTCLECCHVSTTFQHFQDLILDIRQANTTSVHDGLESYFSKERLDGDEAYHCEKCKKKVAAHKKFSIERAPKVLCIQLKRFNINSFYGGSKISKPIATPSTIELTKYQHKTGMSSNISLKYRLVSMVFHHGSSVNSGHYTALGCTSSGSYYYFNDEQVNPSSVSNHTSNPNAYIIFYELVSNQTPHAYCNRPVKSSSAISANSLSPLTYGNANRSTNGFFNGKKRDSPFSMSYSNKLPEKKPCTVTAKSPPTPIIKCHSTLSTPSILKPSPTNITPVKESTSSSESPTKLTNNSTLVPYAHSSDSDDSGSENKQPVSQSQLPSSLISKISTPLVKKNSTLTSLLSTTAVNENSSHHMNPAARFVPRPVLVGGDKKSMTLPTKSPSNLESLETEFAVTLPYSKEESAKEVKIPENNDSKSVENGHLSVESMPQTSSSGDWLVTNEGNHNSNSSPTKGQKSNDFKKQNGCAINEDDDFLFVSNTQLREPQNGYSNQSYLSQNGYGGKVLTWNGNLSNINKESENDQKASKRSFDAEAEIDKGRIKKPKTLDREVFSNSQSSAKNHFQQYQNNMNANHQSHKWKFNQPKHTYNNYPRPRHNHNRGGYTGGNNKRVYHCGHRNQNRNNHFYNMGYQHDWRR